MCRIARRRARCSGASDVDIVVGTYHNMEVGSLGSFVAYSFKQGDRIFKGYRVDTSLNFCLMFASRRGMPKVDKRVDGSRNRNQTNH